MNNLMRCLHGIRNGSLKTHYSISKFTYKVNDILIKRMGYVIIDLPQRLIWKEVVHWILRTKIKGLKKFVRMPWIWSIHTDWYSRKMGLKFKLQIF